ncbi:MAG: hypothetical protein KIT09_33570 [Bryobacteraceae bacterium]|nr:hypothetical protein [Bryobacteraceae bacterium]
MDYAEAERLLIVPAVFDHRIVKLDVLQGWPPRLRQVRAAIHDGTARNRPHGAPEDFGIRI